MNDQYITEVTREKNLKFVIEYTEKTVYQNLRKQIAQ